MDKYDKYCIDDFNVISSRKKQGGCRKSATSKEVYNSKHIRIKQDKMAKSSKSSKSSRNSSSSSCNKKK